MISIKAALVGFVGKYGPHSKLIATSVLNVIAPGSSALISITETAIEAAKDIADDIDHKAWEQRLIAKVGQGQAEVERLARLVEYLSGPLAAVCDKAMNWSNDPELLTAKISEVIATNPSLSKTLQEIQSLKIQFNAFQGDIRKIARNQEEVRPVYDRMNRVADYFDELWQAGIQPREFVNHIAAHRQVANQIQQGNTANVDRVIDRLQTATPNSASVCVLEAAAATREFNYLGAQKSLTKAIKLRPGDPELANVAKQVTVMATRTFRDSKSSVDTENKRRLQRGDDLDGWYLEARRGAGGWGQVFRASKGGETKAIKVMHPELAADRAFLQRFKKEIASLWGLPRHANLLSIDRPETSFGFCMKHQTWYLVTEYIDGPTLESFLANKGPLSESQAIKVFKPLLEGLALAHDADIVHRDIKPSNMIFRTSDRRLVLVDFGLAVGVDDFGETTVGGMSIQFAAPEQHYGGSATKASDVFSLCSVMHYALNYEDPARRLPHAFSPELAPDSLREALQKGMKMAPEQRAPDARALLASYPGTSVRNRSIKNPQTGPSDGLEHPSEVDQPTPKTERGETPVRNRLQKNAETASGKTSEVKTAPSADLMPPANRNQTSNPPVPINPPVKPVKSTTGSSLSSRVPVAKGRASSGDSDGDKKFASEANSQRKPRRVLFAGIAAAVILCLVAGGAPLAWYLQDARVMSQRKSKLNDIVIALHAFEEVNGRFPASDSGHQSTRDNEPYTYFGYSWRTFLFAQGFVGMGQKKDFGADLSLDWLSLSSSESIGNRRKAMQQPAPDCFRSPIDKNSDKSDTSYVGIADDRGFFLPIEQLDSEPYSSAEENLISRGRKLVDVPGGLANTIAVMEVNNSEIHWMAHADFTIEEAISYIKKNGEYTLVAMADGSVQKAYSSTAETKLRAMMTIDHDEYAPAPQNANFEIKIPDKLKIPQSE